MHRYIISGSISYKKLWVKRVINPKLDVSAVYIMYGLPISVYGLSQSFKPLAPTLKVDWRSMI